MSYSAEVLADSPLAYWRLGDGSGTTAADSSGNSRPSTWTATPTYVSGLLVGDANGAAKPSTGTFASIADAAWMDVSALTVEALVNYDTVVASSGVVDRYGAGGVGESGFLFWLPSSKFSFAIRDNVGDKSASSTASISTGTTYHIVGTCDGSNVKLYVNGSLVATTACGPLAAGSAPIIIGKTVFNGAGTAGTIDEVAVYGSALSSTRVAAHYAASTTAATDGTVAAVAATATASAAVPVVSAASRVTGVAATATATAVAPTVSATGTATVLPPAATATAAAIAPTVTADATVTGVAAAATAAALAPSVAATVSATVAAVPASATAGAIAPIVTDGSGNRTVFAVPATATATARPPVWTQVLDVATDTTNALDGLSLVGVATVTVTKAPATAPATLVLTDRFDKAVPYPVPTVSGGRVL